MVQILAMSLQNLSLSTVIMPSRQFSHKQYFAKESVLCMILQKGIPSFTLSSGEDFRFLNSQLLFDWQVERAYCYVAYLREYLELKGLCNSTQICQKCVEILGPLGYSREWLVEKLMRDSKIADIYEGTHQINQMIVARQILGYSGKDLR